MPPGASLLYKAISTPLLLHAFPLFGSPLLACQPPSPSLPSTPENDTSTVLSPTSPRFPLRRNPQPRPASSQCPLGRGTIKTGQVLSRSVESRVSDGTLPVWLQMWLNWVLRVLLPSQNNNVSVVLEISIRWSARWWQHINIPNAMQPGWSDIFGLTAFRQWPSAPTHASTNPLLYPSVSQLQACPHCPWLLSPASLHNPCQPFSTLFFLPSLLPSLPLLLLLWISVFRVWNIKETYLATPSGTESELSPESGRRR